LSQKNNLQRLNFFFIASLSALSFFRQTAYRLQSEITRPPDAVGLIVLTGKKCYAENGRAFSPDIISLFHFLLRKIEKVIRFGKEKEPLNFNNRCDFYLSF
jgi:hypothetical protein